MVDNRRLEPTATAVANWVAVAVAVLSLGLFILGPFGLYGLIIFAIIVLGTKKNNVAYHWLAFTLLTSCGFLTIFSIGAYVLLGGLILLVSLILRSHNKKVSVMGGLMFFIGLVSFISLLFVILLGNYDPIPIIVFGFISLTTILLGWIKRDLIPLFISLGIGLSTIVNYPEIYTGYVWARAILGVTVAFTLFIMMTLATQYEKNS